MPAVIRVHTGSSAGVVGAVLLVMAACLVVAWWRAGQHEQGKLAKGQRGRLHDFTWCVALMPVLAAATALAYPVLRAHGLQWWLLIVVVLAALSVAAAPWLAARVVCGALIALGLCAMMLVRHYGIGTAFLFSGSAGLAQYRVPPLVLAGAYASLLLGGWLGWRELANHPAAARLVLGRMAAATRTGQPWGLLMLPIAVAAGALIQSGAWAVVTITLLAGSMLVIRRSPGLAAQLAAAGLVLLGLAGLLLAKGAMQGAPWVPYYALYGPVEVFSRDTSLLAAAEALALLGFGGWLVPRTYPGLRGRLGLASVADLTRRVQRLTESRAVAVDTAAADLRRLERDLHDGAQARLVALGMNLRAVERLIPANPDAALALVAEARETSARALTELRALVRGVHPPVLADRGLADAVRALALDCPMRVETEIDLPGRPPAPVETACYFAIAEVLTNAAKHSGARQGRVSLMYADGMLRIVVTDFGLGGADPARGSGLAGVEKRLATFDGIMAVSSPVGGPTMVVMEVPCALSSPKTSSC